MKLKTYNTLFLTVIMVISSSMAIAAESAVEGEVTVKGVAQHINGDRASYDEYSDSRDGFFGSARLNYDVDNTFVRFNADDVGYDTQKYSLDGGVWDSYKYNLHYDETPHNITFDAKTFLSGVGGNSMGLHADPNDVSTWSSFNYKTERDRVGGSVSVDFFKPFFLDISAQNEQKDGLKPASFGDFAGGGRVIEVPEPIDYRTDMFHVEAGYNKKPFFGSLSYFYSRFSNDNPELDFYDPVLDDTASLALAPDNNDYKLAFKGAAFLPFNSKFSLNAGTARTKSDIDTNDILDLDAFKGKTDTDNFDLVLTTNPIAAIDGKIFDKYYDRENKSDGDEDHFGYTNNSFGGQIGAKLPEHFRLTVGYTNARTKYDERFDATERKDNLYSTDLAWSGLDFATFKVGYERLDRDSDRNGTDAVADFDNIWRFDVAPADRDTYKASVDLTPIDDLSVTLGYKYKDTDFKDSALAGSARGVGLRDYKADEVFVDASYAISTIANVYGYFDYEKTRNLDYGSSSSDPASDWKVTQREKNYDYGLGADFFVIPKVLTVKAQYDYTRSDGTADFSYLDTATPAGVDSNEWGDYRKNAATIKAIYDMNKSITLAGGYAYEHYTLDDVLLNGYEYLPSGTTTAYLTGAYSEPDYEANVVFSSLTYKF